MIILLWHWEVREITGAGAVPAQREGGGRIIGRALSFLGKRAVVARFRWQTATNAVAADTGERE